jgi:hypothetical protein
MEHIQLFVNCSTEEIQSYTTLFNEFHVVFSWSYEEMLGIDPSIILHQIKTYLEDKPV